MRSAPRSSTHSTTRRSIRGIARSSRRRGAKPWPGGEEERRRHDPADGARTLQTEGAIRRSRQRTARQQRYRYARWHKNPAPARSSSMKRRHSELGAALLRWIGPRPRALPVVLGPRRKSRPAALAPFVAGDDRRRRPACLVIPEDLDAMRAPYPAAPFEYALVEKRSIARRPPAPDWLSALLDPHDAARRCSATTLITLAASSATSRTTPSSTVVASIGLWSSTRRGAIAWATFDGHNRRPTAADRRDRSVRARRPRRRPLLQPRQPRKPRPAHRRDRARCGAGGVT